MHGVEELGVNNKKIRSNDVKTITKFLEVVGVSGQIESGTCLGKQELNKKWKLKVVMNTINQKNNVM